MGYVRGLRHGAIIGAALGLLYAPQAGADLRRQVSRWLGPNALPPPTENSGAPASPAAPRRRAAGGNESRTRRP